MDPSQLQLRRREETPSQSTTTTCNSIVLGQLLRVSYQSTELKCDRHTLTLFSQLNPDIPIHPRSFISKSIDLGVRRAGKRQDASYLATPCSQEACNHHHVTYEDGPVISDIANCEFHLVNIQGMITNNKKNSEFLNLTVESTTLTKIVAITESHLRKNQHLDSEILKYFPEYSFTRTDKDTEYDIDDEDQLLSHGGCMLLTSPNIIVTDKVSFSKAHC